MRRTDEAAIRAAAVAECIAIVLRHFANDWNGVACITEMRRLSPETGQGATNGPTTHPSGGHDR